jgi:hypothetical protein
MIRSVDLVERREGQPENRHPWEQARRRLVSAVVSDAVARGDRAPETALDIGSGDAWLGASLAQDLGLRRVDAFDVAYSDHDLRELRTPVVNPIRERPEGDYDLVFLFDVIEHVEDDVALLGVARERVAGDGVVAVSVPAWPRLATAHDRALGHYRRYTPQRLRSSLSAAGLEPIMLGGAFSSLLPVRALQRIRERATQERPLPDLGAWQGGAVMTAALSTVLAADALLGAKLASRKIVVPGLSLWTVAVPVS